MISHSPRFCNICTPTFGLCRPIHLVTNHSVDILKSRLVKILLYLCHRIHLNHLSQITFSVIPFFSLIGILCTGRASSPLQLQIISHDLTRFLLLTKYMHPITSTTFLNLWHLNMIEIVFVPRKTCKITYDNVVFKTYEHKVKC